MTRNNKTYLALRRQIIESIKRGEVPAICHICGGLIDMSLKGSTNPRAFSLDHIIPVGKGGADVMENLKPSHFDCNRRKKNNLDFRIKRKKVYKLNINF